MTCEPRSALPSASVTAARRKRPCVRSGCDHSSADRRVRGVGSACGEPVPARTYSCSRSPNLKQMEEPPWSAREPLNSSVPIRSPLYVTEMAGQPPLVPRPWLSVVAPPTSSSPHSCRGHSEPVSTRRAERRNRCLLLVRTCRDRCRQGLVGHSRPPHRRRVARTQDDEGVDLVRQLAKLQPKLIVMEASGGYERSGHRPRRARGRRERPSRARVRQVPGETGQDRPFGRRLGRPLRRGQQHQAPPLARPASSKPSSRAAASSSRCGPPNSSAARRRLPFSGAASTAPSPSSIRNWFRHRRGPRAGTARTCCVRRRPRPHSPCWRARTRHVQSDRLPRRVGAHRQRQVPGSARPKQMDQAPLWSARERSQLHAQAPDIRCSGTEPRGTEPRRRGAPPVILVLDTGIHGPLVATMT